MAGGHGSAPPVKVIVTRTTRETAAQAAKASLGREEEVREVREPDVVERKKKIER